jgi:Ca2+-binding RTX toxin-like protein
VRCTSGSVRVDAGDRADRVDTTAISARVNALGGADDDVMAAGTGHENYLAGGPGRDDLVGGPHTDSLDGGDGPDRISAGAGADNISGDDTVPSPDVIDGGGGSDTFRGDHLVPSLALDIDLRRLTPNGAPGDGDTIRSVESLWGSSQTDRLTGTNGPNGIIGGEGADIVLGLGGPDDLMGGLLLDGGSGNDQLSDATRNRCGPGRDTVDAPGRPRDRLPIVGADCERVEGGDAFERIRLLLRRRRLRGRLLRYRGDCALIYGPRCRTTITARTARSLRRLKRSAPLVARTTVRKKEGRTVLLSLRLNRRGRRALRRGRRWLRFDFNQRGRSGQEHDAFATFVRRRFR